MEPGTAYSSDLFAVPQNVTSKQQLCSRKNVSPGYSLGKERKHAFNNF